MSRVKEVGKQINYPKKKKGRRQQPSEARPLYNKKIVLDVENCALKLHLRRNILALGGTISDDIESDERPWCVVSDYGGVDSIENSYKEKRRKKMQKRVTDRLLSVSTISSLESTDSLVEIDQNISDQPNSRKAISLVQQKKVDLPILLRQAKTECIMIKSAIKFNKKLLELRNRIKSDKKQNKQSVLNAPQKTMTNINKSRKLRAPFILVQYDNGRFTPFYKEFYQDNNVMKVFSKSFCGKSIFHKASTELMESRKRLEKEGLKQAQTRRRGRTVVSKSLARFCEICVVNSTNIHTHLKSVEHRTALATAGFYDQVDSLTGSLSDFIPEPLR